LIDLRPECAERDEMPEQLVTDAPSAAPLSGPVLVFDSGVGGLTVLAEIRGARPDVPLLFVADDAVFPYGALEHGALVARVVGLLGPIIDCERPSLVVIACNTASTAVLPPLRARFAVPFVGTVPAVKPAAAATRTGLVSVLATPATVARDYTRALIRDYAPHCDVTLVGSARLAALAEARMRDETVADEDIRREIAPCFVERGGRRTDTVVLACTHYPWLLDRFERLAPWPVRWIDPAPAIARRVTALLVGAAPFGATGRFLFTSGRVPAPPLRDILARYGLHEAARMPA
jgi:glutamate racemase